MASLVISHYCTTHECWYASYQALYRHLFVTGYRVYLAENAALWGFYHWKVVRNLL